MVSVNTEAELSKMVQALKDGVLTKFDSPVAAVVPSPPMLPKEIPTEENTAEAKEVERLLQHAAAHGIDSLSSDELSRFIKHCNEIKKIKKKTEAIAAIDRLSHELFLDLKS